MSKVKRFILGITGGIASGKTTVMKLLAGRGIPTISSDALSHAAIRRGRPAYRAVLRRFGRGVLTNAQIDRAKLGKIVFADPKERKALEKIIHPWVIKGLKKFIGRHHEGVVALDIPLLFESHLTGLVDKTVVVYATRAQQLARLRRRNALSRAQALTRLRAQMSLRLKRARADVVINNTRTKTFLRSQINAFLNKCVDSL